MRQKVWYNGDQRGAMGAKNGIHCEALAKGWFYRIAITSTTVGFEKPYIPIGD
jgi:hypothetical protein